MPYVIRKSGDEYCVYGKDDGEKKGCSDSKEQAVKHMRARYANAGDKALTTDGTKSLTDIAYDILEFGADNPQMQDLAEQILIDSDELDVSMISDDVTTTIKEERLISKVIEGIKGLINPPVIGDTTPPQVTLMKEKSGRTRVMMRVSNMFKDRHGEIITQEAHRNFAKHVTDHPEEMPEFWVWHIPGSRWGKADVVDFSDGFLSASGLVDEGYESLAKALVREDFGVSHGFRGVSLTGKGFIDAYKSFEFSPLPRDSAANIVTGLMLVKEEGAVMDPTKRQTLIDIGVSEKFLDQWDSDNSKTSETLKALGFEFKEVEGETVVGSDPNSNGDTPAGNPNPASNSDPTISDVLQAVRELGTKVSELETKQKDYEGGLETAVSKVMEAAIVPGQIKGHVPTQSKGNEPPTELVKKQNEWDEELNAMLVGGRD